MKPLEQPVQIAKPEPITKAIVQALKKVLELRRNLAIELELPLGTIVEKVIAGTELFR